MDIDEAIRHFAGSRAGVSIHGERNEDGLTLHIAGALDMDCSQSVQELLVWVIESGVAKPGLVIDLGGVNYVSSTGVGALTFALVASKRMNVRLRLAGLQGKVRSVFELLGFMDFFEEVPCDG